MQKKTRNTPAKLAIVDILMKTENALSQHEIQEELGELCDRVTTYRVLDRLCEQGLLHKVIDPKGITKYAKCSTCTNENHQHDHLHFYCEDCKHLTCVVSTKPKIDLPENYEARTVNFLVTGRCNKCTQKDN